MAFTPVEIIALVFILVTLIKLIVILISPQSWNNNVVKKVFSRPRLVAWVSLLLAGVVFYYLIQELTVVQILASMAFLGLLMAMGLVVYSKELPEFIDKIYKQGNIVKRFWLTLVIWVLLLVWGLKELFL